HRPADYFFHDFGGAAIDGLDPGVQVGLRHRVLGHVAVPAVQLQAAVHHPLVHLAEPPLGHRRVFGAEFAAHVVAHAAVHEHATDLHFGGHLGQFEADVLELADRPAERFAV